MSHHLSGPDLRPPADDPRLDLTDVFAFQSPEAAGATVLVMNVNSFAFVPGASPYLHPGAVYKLCVDNDGDDRPDLAFSFVFGEPAGGEQAVTVYYGAGERAGGFAAMGEAVVADAPVAFGPDPAVAEAGPLRFTACLRSDPFFADLEGIGDGFTWTGRDTMAGKNVVALVLEAPDDTFGAGPEIGVWGRVSVKRDGRWISVDRGAHPSLTAYFNPDDRKDEYNAGEPVDDVANYRDAWIEVLKHTGGYTVADAEHALRTVLPDILRFDRSKPARYPNGRRLDDDVTDARLHMVTNGRIPSDGIGPHSDLLPHFPYLGPPHA
ncbi:DUF4331 family protein [Sinosporangium siamense]|uniref:DUF4331 domain-containing protein n=1 Tax=Sinosporangium siamense TaxID=1367973 RepID=A0A919RQN3_9ACTN|nr:DUF4331 family protein [Sinosporangium siamense]GII97497.1 hypothetical protein Ssi02_77280 [Sinosporangium siamense]